MTRNQEVVLRYMDGFRKTNREEILSCLTEDVRWRIPGSFEISGKKAFNSHIVDEGFEIHPEITIDRLTEADDVVVAEGTVRARRTDKSVIDLAFCDVFEMEHGKIAALTSYLMPLPLP